MFNHLKVSTRLALGFGVATLMGVSIAALAAVEMRGLASSLQAVTAERMPLMEMAQTLKENFNASGRYARNLALMPDTASRETEKNRIAETRRDNDRLVADLDKIVTLPKARQALKSISETHGAYDASLDRFIGMAEAGRGHAELSAFLVKDLRPAQVPLLKAVDEFLASQKESANALAKDGAADANRAVVIALALAAMMGLCGTVACWVLTRGLRRALGAEPAQLSAAAQRVAAGDLGTVAGAAAAPADSVLTSLGDMQARLAAIVGQVRTSSDSIATGSAQIATGNADLSQRTEEQASNLQQTAASMEQLSGTVKSTAETAVHANELAASASAAAVKGGEMVGEVVQTMQDITTASKKIADIIGVIDGIAFQTNILALNAAVEAARAGEQGRGFAVVASEVRNLAGRSAAAAKEIKGLIGASVDRVEAGARQVKDAGVSMAEIVSQVQRVSQAISEISTAASEQSTGIGQVGDAVTQLDQVTQQNAALVEQSAAAADSLKQQAARLADVVSVFRLATSAVAAPAPSERPKAAMIERRGPNRAPNVVRPAFKTKPDSRVAPPRLAPPPAPQPAQTGTDDWETF
jgi:methyl-accepting chemotaxis protein